MYVLANLYVKEKAFCESVFLTPNPVKIKPLASEEVEDGISREQGKTAIYRFRIAGAVYQKWWLQEQTRRVLQQMSDEQLKDIGLRRDQIN